MMREELDWLMEEQGYFSYVESRADWEPQRYREFMDRWDAFRQLLDSMPV